MPKTSIDYEKSKADLDADITQEQRDGILAVDAVIKQNSNQQKNKKSYGDVKSVMDKVASGELTLDKAKEELKKIGAENNDTTLQVYLTSVNAILNHPLDEEKKSEAIKTVQEGFAFLSDEKAPHDLEACLKASKKVLESGKIPQNLKIEIEKDVCDVDVKVVDELQQSELEKKEKEAKEDEKKKEALEKEKGINKANIAKKTVKFGAALGVAAGFPPFGVAIAIGMLYVARNWGADEKEVDEAKEQELEKGKAMIQSAKERIAKAKSSRLQEEKLRQEDSKVDLSKDDKKEAAPSEKADQTNSQPLSDQETPLKGDDKVDDKKPTATKEAIGVVAVDAQAEVAATTEVLKTVIVENTGELKGAAVLTHPQEETAVKVAQDGGEGLSEVAALGMTGADQNEQDSGEGKSEENEASLENSQSTEEPDAEELAKNIVREAEAEVEVEAGVGVGVGVGVEVEAGDKKSNVRQ